MKPLNETSYDNVLAVTLGNDRTHDSVNNRSGRSWDRSKLNQSFQKIGELRNNLARRAENSLNRHEESRMAGECPGGQGEHGIGAPWTQPEKRVLGGQTASVWWSCGSNYNFEKKINFVQKEDT